MGLHDHFLKFVNGIVRWSSNFSNFSEIHEDSASKSYWSNKGAAKQLIGHYCASWQSGQAPSAVILALVTGIMSIKSGVVKIHRKCQQLEKFVWNKPTNICFLYQSVLWYQLSIPFEIWKDKIQHSFGAFKYKSKGHQLEGLQELHPQTINNSSSYATHVWIYTNFF